MALLNFPLATAPVAASAEAQSGLAPYRTDDLCSYVDMWMELVNMDWFSDCGP